MPLGDALRQVHLAAEDGIVLDSQAEGTDVAFDGAASAQLDAAAGDDIALHSAQSECL